MSSIVETLYQQALLADAAYVDRNLTGALLNAAFTGRGFTAQQISTFNGRYQVVEFLPNTNSGLSATIYFDTERKEQVLAIRGTEPTFPQ